uniref:Cytochrome P450 monooxygenase CYP5012A2 n=1 Tax=Tetrahymena thermophila TaxID=5911 RepID=B0FSU2_TETTH|nr:cytochrome P450 monooxygenase CYP5012A2 [Tetrahymena thermophila]
MGLILQIIIFILTIISLLALYLVYKFYVKPKILMGFYEKQGVKNLCFYPFIGKYSFVSRDIMLKGDGFYSIKDFLAQNPGCKYSMTNLAEFVCIQLYDPDIIKEFYNCKHIVKHKFGVEIFQEFMNGIVFAEGEEHTRKRKIISQAFHYQLLQSMISPLSEIYDEFIDKVKDKKVDDCISMFQDISGESVLRLFFSKSFKDYKYRNKTMTETLSDLINCAGQMAKSTEYAFLGKGALRFGKLSTLQKTTKDIKKIFKEVITNRIDSTNLDDLKHKQRKDMIDYLIENQGIDKIESENKITIETIIEEFITFYVAGLDTTGHTLGMAMYYLSVYPELSEEIKATIKSQADLTSENIKNMKYLQAFVNEVLRHYTIADQLFMRTATQDIQLGNLKIKKGTVLNVGNLENHFDPKYFKDPHQFNPQRWLDGSLDKLPPYIFNPFSAGKNNCIGQHFAQINIKIGLIKFIQSFDFEIDPNYKLILTFQFLIEPVQPIALTFKSKKL